MKGKKKKNEIVSNAAFQIKVLCSSWKSTALLVSFKGKSTLWFLANIFAQIREDFPTIIHTKCLEIWIKGKNRITDKGKICNERCYRHALQKKNVDVFGLEVAINQSRCIQSGESKASLHFSSFLVWNWKIMRESWIPWLTVLKITGTKLPAYGN